MYSMHRPWHVVEYYSVSRLNDMFWYYVNGERKRETGSQSGHGLIMELIQVRLISIVSEAPLSYCIEGTLLARKQITV